MTYGVEMEVLIAEGPDRAAIWTTSAINVEGTEVELGEEGAREEEGKAGKEGGRCKGWAGVGERENN